MEREAEFQEERPLQGNSRELTLFSESCQRIVSRVMLSLYLHFRWTVVTGSGMNWRGEMGDGS